MLDVPTELDVDILAVVVLSGREPEMVECCDKLKNTIRVGERVHILDELCSHVLDPQGGSSTLSDVGTRPGAVYVDKPAGLDILVDVVGVLVENDFDLEVLRGT